MGIGAYYTVNIKYFNPPLKQPYVNNKHIFKKPTIIDFVKNNYSLTKVASSSSEIMGLKA